MNNSPAISVVVPVYNPDDSFQNTIQSVLNQTYKDFELIVVDDGSDIDVKHILKQFADSSISYYKLPHQNANVARNYGIAQSKGKYIAMLDSDDLWLENHLEDCINTLQQTDADGLYGSIIKRNKNGVEQFIRARRLDEDEAMINYLLATGYGAQTSTLFLTADSAKGILWDSKLNRHQDYDFVVRYSKRYQLTAKEKTTVIYTLKPTGKMIDFNSCIRFINSNIDDIDPQLYHNYNHNMLMMAKSKNADSDIIKYYIKESTRYKSFLPYYRYVMIRYPKNWFERLRCKLEYLFHIALVKVES